MLTLGVDPGETGAACLLDHDGRTILCVWSWKKMKRKAGTVYRVRHSGGEVELATLGLVGMLILAHVTPLVLPTGCTLAVEHIFRGITLAEATGKVAGPLEAMAHGEVHRPRSSAWRRRILGIKSEGALGADQCEAWAVRAVPSLFLNVESHMPLLSVGHVAESCAIARDGWAMASGSIVG